MHLLIVPQPNVTLSIGHTGILHSGTVLTLTCTVTLDDTNVDSGESVEITWSGPRNIPGERDSVTEASGSGESYTGSLTISPLVKGKDDGQYICNVKVSGGNPVLEANGSDYFFIHVGIASVQSEHIVCFTITRSLKYLLADIYSMYCAICNCYQPQVA